MATERETGEPVRAACLTPPGVGGIAVIQVAGRRAAAVVTPFLRSKRPIELERMGAAELRLCRWADGDEVLDDALVTVRHRRGGETIVDISLHGGRRIVQRALLMLKRAGARIVEPIELLDRGGHPAGPVERELLPILLRAKTRAVASWLARLVDRLPREIARALQELQADHRDAARLSLATLCRNAGKVRYLLDGVRVVVTGGPNVGKSALVNALAGREHALVSEVPGTTRDWVDHPGAVHGVPVTFVDTAGIHATDDPLEREAIRRARQQIKPADVVLRVIDLSAPPSPADRRAVAAGPKRRRRHVARPREKTRHHEETAEPEPADPCRVFVWNKSDLPHHAGHTALMARAGEAGMRVSARTEAGLSDMRLALLQAIGLENWQEKLLSPVTERQVTACRQALSALAAGGSDPAGAIAGLRELLGRDFSAERGPGARL